MRLTLHTDYALRMVLLLAMEPQRPLTIEDIATRYGISRNHLMKVARTLVQAGIVEGLRGRGGGLRLARRPEDIRLGAVVRATEDGFALVECFEGGPGTCRIKPACGLRNPLKEALQAFLDVLDAYTIADLISDPLAYRGMRRFLRVASHAN